MSDTAADSPCIVRLCAGFGPDCLVGRFHAPRRLRVGDLIRAGGRTFAVIDRGRFVREVEHDGRRIAELGHQVAPADVRSVTELCEADDPAAAAPATRASAAAGRPALYADGP